METAPSRNTPSVNTRPPSITRNRTTASAGMATSTREVSSERSRRGRLRRRGGRARPDRPLGAGGVRPAPRIPAGVRGAPAISRPSPSTEAPPALRELGQRLLQRLAREVGPQLVAEDELRVGGLPQEVVRQAALAARADDEVGIVHLRRVQTGAELLLATSAEAARGVDDLRPAAVVEGHEQRDPAVLGGQGF